jgi:ribosome-associated protein
MIRDFRRTAKIIARAAEAKKAMDIVVLDIRRLTDVADYMVIVGAESSPQMRAIYEGICESLESLGLRPLHQDGRFTERWLAIDYGGVVVHILLPPARQFYRLENLWEGGKAVHWEESRKKGTK